MQNQEYVAVYPRDTSYYRQVPSAGESDDRVYFGHAFGQLLYDRLADTPIDQRSHWTEQEIQSYEAWSNTQMQQHLQEVISLRNPLDSGLEPNRFHVLNHIMLREWRPWPTDPSARSRIIKSMQHVLVSNAAQLFITRERIFKTEISTGQRHPSRGHVEGLLSEFDTALTLLYLQHDVPAIDTVVPAPYQFEANHTRYNADFVVIADDQAIGIQVKSRVRENDISRYDPDRIILVDGAADLGNELYKKIPGKSSPQRIGWAGILCAQEIARVQTHGKNAVVHGRLGSSSNQAIMYAKQLVRPLVSDIKPEMGNARRTLGSKILPKLGLEQVTHTIRQGS